MQINLFKNKKLNEENVPLHHLLTILILFVLNSRQYVEILLHRYDNLCKYIHTITPKYKKNAPSSSFIDQVWFCLLSQEMDCSEFFVVVIIDYVIKRSCTLFCFHNYEILTDWLNLACLKTVKSTRYRYFYIGMIHIRHQNLVKSCFISSTSMRAINTRGSFSLDIAPMIF